jgi:hypothetical protein
LEVVPTLLDSRRDKKDARLSDMSLINLMSPSTSNYKMYKPRRQTATIQKTAIFIVTSSHTRERDALMNSKRLWYGDNGDYVVGIQHAKEIKKSTEILQIIHQDGRKYSDRKT